MSSEERKKILQMVEDGKISAEEAVHLMAALDDDDEMEGGAAEAEVEVLEGGSGSGYERTEAPEFERIKARARRFALIPLWTGVVVTLLSAWAVYSIQQSAGTNFWFYCMILPLMLGVLLIALGGGGRASRWVYVDVKRKDAKPGDGPRHITLAFPAPLGFLAWFFDTFGHNFKGMSRGKADGIVQMMQAARDSNEPFMVHVDDDNAHVQVYIG
ncbi:MAG: SHOCT-like domain-containing protein [Chloroflexota bacterium]